jgi:fermentation-respiration switch protein FrsA (DUF1100 family)
MTRANKPRRMLNALIALALGLAGLWLCLRWFERANVYQPSRAWAATPDLMGVAWEHAQFQAKDGTRLSGWFLPARPGAEHPEIAVLVNHGNGGNVSHRFPLYELLLGLGVNVFAYDYRGYGQSEGRPTEEGTYMDAEAALDWLRARGFKDSDIIVHGESLGAGIAAELALRRPGLRALVIRSSFTSIADLGAELFPFLPVRTVSTIRYDTRSRLPRIRVPVLILHSREDTLVGFHHAERNFEAANQPKWLREIRGDHNDQPEASPEAYAEALRLVLPSGDSDSRISHPTDAVLPAEEGETAR